jgi:hypothetical protein
LTGKRIVSLPFSDHCEPLVRDSADLHELFNGLIEISRQRGCKEVEVRPLSISETLPRLGNGETFHLHRLDLRPGVQSVYGRFHKDSIQRKIRRAERERLILETGNNGALIETFYQLVLRTRRRHGLPAQPITWFRYLAEEMGDRLKIRLAYKDRLPIAGILSLQHRSTLMYKYGASDERFHNLGGMACVFWHALQDAMAGGLEEMDMGRSDLDNPGLTTFKEHWGATRSELAYWRYPAAVSRSAAHGWRMRLAQRACNYAPDFLLGAMGSLLYRHVG